MSPWCSFGRRGLGSKAPAAWSPTVRRLRLTKQSARSTSGTPARRRERFAATPSRVRHVAVGGSPRAGRPKIRSLNPPSRRWPRGEGRRTLAAKPEKVSWITDDTRRPAAGSKRLAPLDEAEEVVQARCDRAGAGAEHQRPQQSHAKRADRSDRLCGEQRNVAVHQGDLECGADPAQHEKDCDRVGSGQSEPAEAEAEAPAGACAIRKRGCPVGCVVGFLGAIGQPETVAPDDDARSAGSRDGGRGDPERRRPGRRRRPG